MSDCFNCKLCDKSIKNKSKKKHLNSQYHQASTKTLVSRYYITNPIFLDVEDIFKKYVYDYNKKIGFDLSICKFELKFDDLTYDFKLRIHNIQPYYYLRKNLMSKIDCFTVEFQKFSLISEMNLTFITNSNNIPYENYLKQSKSMLEWRLSEQLAKIPKLIKGFDRIPSHPPIGECSNLDTLEDQDQNMELMM